MPESRTPHRPWLAAILSFFFPGLGQAYAGRWRLAAAFAAPVVLLVLGIVCAFTVLRGQLRVDVFSTAFIGGVLALDAAVFAWRAASIAQAGLVPAPSASVVSPPARRGRDLAVVVLLLVLTVAMHAYVGMVLGALDQTLQQVFGGGEERPRASGAANGPDEPIN